MKVRTRSRNATRKSIFLLTFSLLASMALSAFAWGQHKLETKPTPPPASKPAHPSTPAPAKEPAHAPAPTRVSLPAAPRSAPNPRSNVSTAAGRSPNSACVGNRAPEPVVVDHIGDISEYRRGPAHPDSGTTPASARSGVVANPRPGSQAQTINRTINRNGMQIQRNQRGERLIVSERNGTRVVTTGAGRGYVQHAYLTRDGRSYYSRTYLDRGVTRVGVYRGYNYGGHLYYGYYPAYWYHPAFYGWATTPWSAPIYWNVGAAGWGWAGAPWYAYYGGYFAPYPVYASPAFWLTDYLIAADLEAAYAARNAADADAAAEYDAGQASGADDASRADGTPMLTPDVKQAIADEVKAQLADEQQQSSGNQNSDSSATQAQDGQAQASAAGNEDVPSALDPRRRTFVVSSNTTVVSDGQQCELSPGDILTRVTNTPDADQNVTAVVSASKKKDCAVDKPVIVSVETLQEMRNHFDEQLYSGIKMLAEKQGTNGMPKAPDTAQTASDVPTPAPDATAAKDLNDQEAAADRAEMEQVQQGSSLADIARQVRAQRQQAQEQSDPQSKPATTPAEAPPQN